MKKKIVALCLVLALALTAIGGATLAYFTDVTEVKENVFTVGDVEIELDEDFDPENAQLLPGSKDKNAINKDVSVENTGTNDAWVRVIVEVPAHLDVLTVKPENYEEIAAKNILHWNTAADAEEKWNVVDACWAAHLSEDQKYNVYTFYYNEILEAGETTSKLLDQVYLDSKVDFNGEKYTFKGEVIDLSNVQINVYAEAIQADGFDTFEAAFAAFDAQN